MSVYKEDTYLLLRSLAQAADNHTLHQYLFDLDAKLYSRPLSRNLNIKDTLYLELFPYLQIKDKVVSLQRPLTEELARKIFEDKSPVVRQSIFQVTHPSYPFTDEVITEFLATYGNTAIAKIAATYFYRNDQESKALQEFIYQQARRFGTYHNPGQKKLIAGRAHTIEEIMRNSRGYRSGVSRERPAHEADAKKTALSLSIKVKDTYSVTHIFADEILYEITKSIGDQDTAYWSIFLKMLPEWDGTYATLIQTTHTLV